ncbi:GFA family protein, partial [Alloalcanivorax venustensis]|nr:GFA family protein [Alcanivorax sp.]
MQSYTGSCLCGGIAFEVRGPLAPIQVCHCQQCR